MRLGSQDWAILTGVWIVTLGLVAHPTHLAAESKAKSARRTAAAGKAASPDRHVTLHGPYSTGSSLEMVGAVNDSLRQQWVDHGVTPSPVAEDSEWIRRVYLDIVGHIPPVEELESFLADKEKSKRATLIDKLLEDPGYVRNWTTVWANLLVGRQPMQRVSRDGLQKFLRESFAKNRPWSDVVFDLLSAEGHFEEHGAVNFLLAHMNDGAVPATAISARLFLGMQVQCTQCHDHPSNDWKQNQFWELNSFFKQAKAVEHRKYDAKSGRMVFDYAELVSNDFEGPVYFEKRNGLLKVAFPKFGDNEVNPGNGTNRRLELAKLMISGDRPQLADAMVNRMWAHFFGYGFTRPVDDMGPHNQPSNPELLERLAAEFVKSKYDLKQLIRWITNSEAYNLTSKTTKFNERDDPANGTTPLFSHMYLKSMSVEQLYDSLLIATKAHQSGSWEQSEKLRQQWMQQFVIAFGTDENDEGTTFNGTIPQALMMMNGELVQNAVGDKKGGYLMSVLNGKGNEQTKVKQLYMSTLARAPTGRELSGARRVLENAQSPLEAFQDLFWALLNSNEFIFNH